MSFLLSPICNESQIDDSGDPLSGGSIETYLAGTSTLSPVYTDISGVTPHSNPVLLNTLGLPDQGEIWLDSSLAYKFIVKDNLGIVQRTIDNISGILVSIPVGQNEWVTSGLTPTFISPDSFSLIGDQRTIFHVGRRTRTVNAGGVGYGQIITSTFAVGITTITLRNDTIPLDIGISAVDYGLISAINTSFAPIPVGSVMCFFQANSPIGWSQVVTEDESAIRIVSGVGGGKGGVDDFSTLFDAAYLPANTDDHALTVPELPPHTHSGRNTAGAQSSVGIGNVTAQAGDTGSTGDGDGHSHAITQPSMDIKYIDMILSSKDS